MTARAGSGAEGRREARRELCLPGVPTSAAVAAVDSREVGVIDNVVDEHAGLAYAEPGELLGDGRARASGPDHSIPQRSEQAVNVGSERENMAVEDRDRLIDR